MIQRLRVKFITASMLSLALVLLVILGGVNAMSYRKIVQDAQGSSAGRRDREAGLPPSPGEWALPGGPL